MRNRANANSLTEWFRVQFILSVVILAFVWLRDFSTCSVAIASCPQTRAVCARCGAAVGYSQHSRQQQQPRALNQRGTIARSRQANSFKSQFGLLSSQACSLSVSALLTSACHCAGWASGVQSQSSSASAGGQCSEFQCLELNSILPSFVLVLVTLWRTLFAPHVCRMTTGIRSKTPAFRCCSQSRKIAKSVHCANGHSRNGNPLLSRWQCSWARQICADDSHGGRKIAGTRATLICLNRLVSHFALQYSHAQFRLLSNGPAGKSAAPLPASAPQSSVAGKRPVSSTLIQIAWCPTRPRLLVRQLFSASCTVNSRLHLVFCLRVFALLAVRSIVYSC